MPTPTAIAKIQTNHGPIVAELYGHHAPKTVKTISGLANGELEFTDPVDGARKQEPFYAGVVFHRIIPDFMIQGGDRTGTGTGGPGFRFDDEIHPELDFTEPYVLAMANAGLQGGRGTNGSQFFITTAPTTWLQGKHTIFGRVVAPASREVVDRIGRVATGPGDRPVEDVVIESFTVEPVA